MSQSDPIVFAATAAGLSDAELVGEIELAGEDATSDEWWQALIDEAIIRHLDLGSLVADNYSPAVRFH